ncbi:MAG: ROK family protein [Chloroherpetonaceae bacterium]|nr:ROK family protein [Chloroherpetonaceae bacterium]MCS7211527.1 ROK family protein [Chloroherpetonaceae bacterium]MDW8019839.1 ROK family protein [Chloroherpetonaceae bacterium]MDW8465094.1 ROK family protein [Chloroherpetonaceae bacterium]
MEPFAIGVDLGGTAIKVASVSQSGNLLCSKELPTEAEKGPEVVIENMLEGLTTVLRETLKAQPLSSLKGVGVGVPGVVSLDGGTISYPPNLPGWTVVRLGERLQTELKRREGLQLPVFVENDANVAALGESAFGAGRLLNDFVMITLGTGVGGGIILNKKIYRGTTGAAGELGHITVDYRSERIHAGIRGSIEGLIGQRRIVEYALSQLSQTPSPILHELCAGNWENLTPKLLCLAAERGDKVALDTWQFVGEVLGAGLGTIVSILDIRKFVVGGGVSGAGELILAPTRAQLYRFTLHTMHEGLEVRLAKLGNRAGVMGAAALCF